MILFSVSANLIHFLLQLDLSQKSTARSCCVANIHAYHFAKCSLHQRCQKGNVSSIYRIRFSFKVAVSKVMKEVIPLVSTVPCILHLLIQSILPLQTLSSENLWIPFIVKLQLPSHGSLVRWSTSFAVVWEISIIVAIGYMHS